MQLIKILPRANGSFLKTYKGTAGNISHVWKQGSSIKIANCDVNGNPRVFLDINKNRKDIYIKAQDGSTIQKQGDKITKLPNLIFNSISELLFK